MNHKVQCVVIFKHWFDMLGGSHWVAYKVIAMYGNVSIDLHLHNDAFNSKNSFVQGIINLLKNNHFYVTTINAFESKFYNINFIDIEDYKTYRFSTK